MADPEDREEYEHRWTQNFQITGAGIDGMRTHVPCPFCAAADFIVHGVLDFLEKMGKGAICKACGRGCRALIDHADSATRFRLVQTSGAKAPDWLGIGWDPATEDPTQRSPTFGDDDDTWS